MTQGERVLQNLPATSLQLAARTGYDRWKVRKILSAMKGREVFRIRNMAGVYVYYNKKKRCKG